ncbi:MAG: 50S ribosomal protein L5 [Candidatus Handelsmanbacteria bacterium RIFCSPLOWO2_12_FULL_64_10]|uniref:Large ribosomal subunit protein uL5 n=1 Tax=Handelsmanbacteria sp. (strain RIFCSPLOWO2_12_FULL_64_10) TaxID=1817868 RepID=A0A1F6C8Y7_HANXR|nr:ribosomal protein L5 [uncultured bacterium]OGG45605.1 MAG: 50S ribosomal protein L5 [Candidatus Handelsmanbacteria bacterium RIFCSPLOWO2_12_FULL_64_10]
MSAMLKVIYEKEVLPALMQQFGYKNVMQVPRLEKVVLNMGVGEAIQTPNLIEGAVKDMTAIAGQKPSVRRSKKAISNFKLRAGVPVGCSVTLRRDRMYEFLDRFLNFAIPRIRDFRGVPADSFDGRGNYTLGIKEQIIFPEIDYDKIDRIRGLDVTIVTTAKTDEEAFEMLKRFGMPFRAA